jgi:hypothetical protein
MNPKPVHISLLRNKKLKSKKNKMFKCLTNNKFSSIRSCSSKASLFVWNGCKIVDFDSHRRCSKDAEASYGKAEIVLMYTS